MLPASALYCFAIDARVALIGFPSVGKSTLLSKVTKTESITGAYEFTTLTVSQQHSTEYEKTT